MHPQTRQVGHLVRGSTTWNAVAAQPGTVRHFSYNNHPITPMGLKHLSVMAVAANSKYALGEGAVFFQAGSRTEESLGYPSMAIGERVG